MTGLRSLLPILITIILTSCLVKTVLQLSRQKAKFLPSSQKNLQRPSVSSQEASVTRTDSDNSTHDCVQYPYCHISCVNANDGHQPRPLWPLLSLFRHHSRRYGNTQLGLKFLHFLSHNAHTSGRTFQDRC